MRKLPSLFFVLGPVVALQAFAPSASPAPGLDEIEAEVRARTEALVAAVGVFDWDAAITPEGPIPGPGKCLVVWQRIQGNWS